MAFVDERAEARALDQLEAIVRGVADEVATWRARAQKAEAELKEAGGGGGSGASRRPDPETKARLGDLETENRALRQRVEAARARVNELLGRLTFLEEQARETGGNGGATK